MAEKNYDNSGILVRLAMGLGIGSWLIFGWTLLDRFFTGRENYDLGKGFLLLLILPPALLMNLLGCVICAFSKNDPADPNRGSWIATKIVNYVLILSILAILFWVSRR